jgi:hypothetical protein
MERSRALEIEHELDDTAAHSNYLKKDERAKKRLLHDDECLREQEAKPEKRSFMQELREATAKVPARDLSRDRGRERDRGR